MKKLIFTIFIVILILVACEENQILSPDSQITQVELNINVLKNLGDNLWYEGWLVWGDDENYQSVGVFQVDDQGVLSQAVFNVNLGYLQESKKFILTIEEDNIPGYIVSSTGPDTTIIDSTEGPSSYRILGCTIMANSGELALGHEDILDFDFIDATGSYMLATPSDTVNPDQLSGVWFVSEDTSGNIVKGLNLPNLPAGWSYEGFVEIDGIAVSTGKFRVPGSADDEILYYDTLSTGYNFPGEDFLVNAPSGLTFPVDLNAQGTEIYISLEPKRPANCNNPFGDIKALNATLSGAAQTGVFYTMENTSASLPSGLIKLNIELYE